MAAKPIFNYQHATLSSAIGLGNGMSYISAWAIAVAGTSYKIGEVITVSGGTALWTAKFRVMAVGPGGVVTDVQPLQHGAYTSKPSNAVATTASGDGTGLTLTLTWTDNAPPPDASWATIQAETQNVRYRDDNTAPTASVGTILLANSILAYNGPLSKFKVIEATASAKLNVAFYR